MDVKLRVGNLGDEASVVEIIGPTGKTHGHQLFCNKNEDGLIDINFVTCAPLIRRKKN